MQNRIVVVVWVVGLVLAAFIYSAGPDQALAALADAADTIGGGIQRVAEALDGRAFDVLRALAIGCFAVFFALSIVAGGRGQRTGWLMLWVSLLFVLLVWHQGREATGHWLLAFVLAGAAALQVTRRLGPAA